MALFRLYFAEFLFSYDASGVKGCHHFYVGFVETQTLEKIITENNGLQIIFL